MILLHGTTGEAAENIKKNGFKEADAIWTCSNPDKTYLVAVSDRYDTAEAVRVAYESGLIAAAKLNTYREDIAIFIFNFPDDIADEELSDDMSCINTDGCYEINNDALNKLINDKKVSYEIKTINHAYIPWMRPFYVAYLNQEYMELDEKLANICKIIKSSSIEMYDEIFDAYDDLNEICDIINKRGEYDD